MRGSAQTRASTLLIGVGVLLVCLGTPATLVPAQAPVPAADASDIAVAPQSAGAPAPPPEPPDAPPPPSVETPGPNTTPSPAPATPGEATEATPPPPPPVASSSTSVSAAGSASVSVGEFFFAPPSITIQAGGTVTWSNDGESAHTVTANSGSFDSGNLDPGQSFSHTFSQPGTFAYFCQYHESLGQKGTVTVQASGSGGGSGGGGEGGTTNSGTSPTTTTPTAPGSESAAGASPDAAGTATQLPSTGMPLAPLLAAGVGLLVAGALLRRRARLS